MQDYKKHILEQLEQGKLSATEALDLLSQDQSAPQPNRPNYQEIPNKNTDERANEKAEQKTQPQDDNWVSSTVNEVSGWAEELFNWAGEEVNHIVESVQDYNLKDTISDIMTGKYGRYVHNITLASQPINQGISILTIIGKNAKVEVTSWDGDTVQLECKYDARRPDTHIFLNEENGNIRLEYNESLMRYVQIKCKVPRVIINTMNIGTKNEVLHIAGVEAETINLLTKNELLKIENVSCITLAAQTRNASIKACGITAEVINFETKNDSIKVEDIETNTLHMKTTNARISASHLDVAELFMHTTNAGIKLDKQLFTDTHWEGTRYLEVHTTNGGITFLPPNRVGINIHAQTTNGSIKYKLDDMYFSHLEKTILEGKSQTYDFTDMKLDVQLSTTNASIKIK